MKPCPIAVLIALLAAPAFCQTAQPRLAPDAPEAPAAEQPAALGDQLASVAAQLDLVQSDFAGDAISGEIAAQLAAQLDVASIAELADQAQIAFLQAAPQFKPARPDLPAPAPLRPKAIILSDSAYNAGTRALDEHKYEEAVKRFESAIAQDPSRADGALYWEAYALNREGKRDEALAAIARLRRDYASSAWLRDAQVLEAEVRQNSGKPVSPEQESNDDLKLLAINSLMNADADRAVPLLDGILKGNGGPSLKDRALFVLAQNKSPRAQQALADYARGGVNPDLQLRAIQYIGMSGTKDVQQLLAAIYGASADVRVKTSIIQSLMMAHDTDALMSIAKNEKDASLRNTAIRDLAASKSIPVQTMLDFYASADAPARREIVNGLVSRGDAKSLIDLARKESDPAMKKSIVQGLSVMRDNKDAMDYMMELLK